MKRKLFCILPGAIPAPPAALAAALLAAGLLFGACAEKEEKWSQTADRPVYSAIPASSTGAAPGSETRDIPDLLDQVAQLERAGMFRPGMGMAESALWEMLGDEGRAVIAAFKELSWAYGHGILEKVNIEAGMEGVIRQEGEPGKERAVLAGRAVDAFVKEKWRTAEENLLILIGDDFEPDSFINWMLLSCALEQNPDDRRAASVYRAIRARYTQFPEYWYRGARAFSGLIAAEYAEICINLAPYGPFAAECRGILASVSGLKPEDAQAIRAKSEIEQIITQAVNAGNPALLESLLPLIALPDNPYTEFTVGALQALAALPLFKNYFTAQAAASRGILAQRLALISRG